MSEPTPSAERILRGIPVSGGVSRGKILVLGKRSGDVPHRIVPAHEIPAEINRLEQALVQTRQDILEVQRKVQAAMGAEEASIFDAHLLVLEDRTLIDEVTRLIEQEHVNAEYAFHTIAEKYAATLAAMGDDYLRERATDMRDVSVRVLNKLLGRSEDFDPKQLTQPCIIVSHDLAPSVTAQMNRNLVLGLATDVGSPTSHTAILARTLRIPAVVGLKNASQQLFTGEYALLDGINGVIIVNPTDQTLFEYGQLIRKQVTLEEKLREVRDQPAVTLDGKRIILSANIEQADDKDAVTESGAEGVGLFRTEYLFINREQLPSEEDQYLAYRQVAAALNPMPVVIRTLDLGGDKFLSHLQLPPEMNPFLGWRAIRFCLQEKEIFRAQLRAILRASVEGNVKVMFPMVSSLNEVIEANALIEQYKDELRHDGLPFDEHIEVGAMIETPSAVMVADALARRLKFFSIGTNDLIQYTLAVDRLNEKIAHLYDPTHPAVIRLIKETVDAGHRNGIWVGVCGELAGDPALVPLLLGLGVDELSAAPPLVPAVKFVIRRLRMPETQELAQFALQCESSAEILARSRQLAQRAAPALFEK